MNLLDFLVKRYGNTLVNSWIPFWCFTPVRRIIRFISSYILPRYLNKPNVYSPKNYTDIIVSFTSFPARIDEVWQVVECMFRQSYQPKKIILWLSQEQFPNEEDIPMSLRKRVNNIFQIRMVSGDIRSHKKYYYVVKEYPNSLILLIDDDLYYPTDMIEQLVKLREDNNGAVVCRYGSKIKYNNGEIQPYSTWDRVTTNSSSLRLFFGSGGGTLFKPSQLYRDLTNLELSLKMTPIADDIWLNAMLRLAGTSLIMLKPRALLSVRSKGTNQTLCSENINEGRNDQQIYNVRSYYKKNLNIDPFAEVL